ncbi:hypothetical protein VNO77_06900 [Canavalia gladiata]|uniref:Uncharacterized protein n=1 Tax=Canavalia gladiata TaxID=3824 RepID=A0AAN9QT52_CANGL
MGCVTQVSAGYQRTPTPCCTIILHFRLWHHSLMNCCCQFFYPLHQGACTRNFSFVGRDIILSHCINIKCNGLLEFEIIYKIPLFAFLLLESFISV